MRIQLITLLILTCLFLLSRYFLAEIFFYPFNMYCGDSITYLTLATDLSSPHPNRPSGYPLFLSVLLPIFYNQWNLLFITQATITFLVFLYFWHVFNKRISLRAFVLYSLIIFFNPLLIFMEKTVMSDSLAYNLLVFGAITVVGGSGKTYSTIMVGIIAGLLPLIRTNYSLFSVFLIIMQLLMIVWTYPQVFQRSVQALALISITCVIPLTYLMLFLQPKSGIFSLSTFGGRALFSRVAVVASCNQLQNIPISNPIHQALLKTCPYETSSSYMQTLFDETGWISTINAQLGISAAHSDSQYRDIASLVLLKNPILSVDILLQSLSDFISSNSDFFRSNMFPLENSCTIFFDKFHIDSNQYMQNILVDFNKSIIVVFAKISAFLQKGIAFGYFFIFPFWLTQEKIKRPQNLHYWESLFTWVIGALYLAVSILFVGFDYRYVLPFWFVLPWCVLISHLQLPHRLIVE